MMLKVAALTSMAMLSMSACATHEQVHRTTIVVEQELRPAETPDINVEPLRQTLSVEEREPVVEYQQLDLTAFPPVDRTPLVIGSVDTTPVEIVAYNSPANTDTQPVLPPATAQERALTVTVNGVTYTAGTFTGSLHGDDSVTAQGEDGYVTITDLAGNTVNLLFASAALDAVNGLVPAGDGVLVYGTFQAEMATDVAAVASQGESDVFFAYIERTDLVWVRTLGTAGYDTISSHVITDDGNVVVVGGVNGGANNTDGALCEIEVAVGDVGCLVDETPADDSFTTVASADSEQGLVIDVETFLPSGELASSTVTFPAD